MAMTLRSLLRQTLPCFRGQADLAEELVEWASTERKPKKGLKAQWQRLSDKFTRSKPVKEQCPQFSCIPYVPSGNFCDTGIYDEFGEEVLNSLDDLPFRRRRMEKNKKVDYEFDHTGIPIVVAPTVNLPSERGIFYSPITVETDINHFLCPESDIIDLPDLDDDECESDLRGKHDSVTKEIKTSTKDLVVTMNLAEEKIIMDWTRVYSSR